LIVGLADLGSVFVIPWVRGSIFVNLNKFIVKLGGQEGRKRKLRRITLEAVYYKYAAGVALPTQEILKTPEPGSNALSKAMQRHTKSHRARYCASRFPM
jgi:hypothetical protein